MEVVFMQYMQVKRPPYMCEENSSCIRLGCFTSEEMDYGVCRKKLDGGSVNVEEGYGANSLQSSFGNTHIVSSNRNLHPSVDSCNGHTIGFM